MPENVAYQLQTAEASPTRLCEIVSESERLDRTKIATKLYNGSYLMQTVGEPVRIKDLHIRAWTRAEQSAVNAAEAGSEIIAAKLGDVTVTGFLLDAPVWSTVVNRDGMFEADVSFVVVES